MSAGRALALLVLAAALAQPSALAALPRPVHALALHTEALSACSGDEVRVNLTVSSLADQLLVVRVSLGSHEGAVEPAEARFSVGAGANLTRVVAVRVRANATRGAYRLRVEASLEGSPEVREAREAELDVLPCAVREGPEGLRESLLTWAGLFGLGTLAVLAAMAWLLVRASQQEPPRPQYPSLVGYGEVGAYRRW